MITKVKGTYDILPEEVSLWTEVENVLRNVSTLFNFKEIRTPILESTELFHRSTGETSDIITKETYDLLDRAGRMNTLRPEGTASVVRSVIENKLYAGVLPAKMFYFGPMFRYERPQKGRYRQFIQFGAECLGTYSPLADADVINYACTIFKALHIPNLVVRINSLGDTESREKYKEALIEYLRPNIDKFCSDCQNRFLNNPLRILDCKVDKDNEYLLNAPKVIDYLSENSKKHFDQVLNYLRALGVNYIVDNNLVRGLDYYTETVFEIEIAGMEEFLGNAKTICAGGRYNNLVKSLDGPEMGACGFAFGVERLIMILDHLGHKVKTQNTHLFVLCLGDKAKEVGIELVNKCRLGGLISEIDYLDKNLKGQFKYAEQIKARFIGILGEDEVEKGTINIKDKVDDTQDTINMNDLYRYILNKFRSGSKCHSCNDENCSECGGEDCE